MRQLERRLYAELAHTPPSGCRTGIRYSPFVIGIIGVIEDQIVTALRPYKAGDACDNRSIFKETCEVVAPYQPFGVTGVLGAATMWSQLVTALMTAFALSAGAGWLAQYLGIGIQPWTCPSGPLPMQAGARPGLRC